MSCQNSLQMLAGRTQQDLAKDLYVIIPFVRNEYMVVVATLQGNTGNLERQGAKLKVRGGGIP